MLAKEAIAVAPWHSGPRQAIVQIDQGELQARLIKGTARQSDFEQLHQSITEWIATNPSDWSIREGAGECLLGLGAFDPSQIGLAAVHFEEAIKRHPSEDWLYLQGAIAYWLMGDLERAKELTAEATRLDSLTPHWDQKIGMARVLWPTFSPKAGIGPEKWVRPASDPASQPDYCEGEPALRLLRKLLKMDNEGA